MIKGKVCPYLAQGWLAKTGDLVTTGRGGAQRKVACVGEVCARYPICVKEVEEAEKK